MAEPTDLVSREALGLANLEKAVGGRQTLVDVLQHSHRTEELDRLIGMLADPRNDKVPIGEMCKANKITAQDFWERFKTASLGRAQIISLCKVAEQLGDVTADAMMRALPHDVPCPECNNVTRLRVKCERCKGSGTVTQLPNLKRQELALKMGGLVKDGAGVNVNVSQTTQVAAGTFHDTMAKFQRASDRVLYGDGSSMRPPAAPVDGEVVAEKTEREDVLSRES